MLGEARQRAMEFENLAKDVEVRSSEGMLKAESDYDRMVNEANDMLQLVANQSEAETEHLQQEHQVEIAKLREQLDKGIKLVRMEARAGRLKWTHDDVNGLICVS